LITLLLIPLFLISCASVSTERAHLDYEKNTSIDSFPPYNGPKSRIQVLRFGIPNEILNRYPELADKRVGWGLYNRIIEGFYDTNRFEFLEEKEEVQKRILEQWALSQSGIYIEEQPLEGLKAPTYLVYAEVYDFSVSHSEVLVGIATEKINTTIIGVQIRIVDVRTGKYIPSSGIGEAQTTAKGIWVSDKLKFDQTTVGIASQKAVNTAIKKLLDRIDKM
ncbi:CsgG/HfaB family protein, partial [Calditrichota bacterium]